MSEGLYCQYAYLPAGQLPHGIGQGIDPQYPLELVLDDPIAALVSRLGAKWLQTVPLRQGRNLAQLKMLSDRCDEIIRTAAIGQPVFPLRPRIGFRSLEAVRAAMARYKPVIVDFFNEVGRRREWLVELYRTPAAVQLTPAAVRHQNGLRQPKVEYRLRKTANLEAHRRIQSELHQAVELVESCLLRYSARHCHVSQAAQVFPPRKEELVYSSSFLVSSSAIVGWLEAVTGLRRELAAKGLLLEWSGPWPPYHFCPELGLTKNPYAILF